MKPQTEFSQRLREWRKSRNMTQAKAAQLLGIAQTTYEHWEQALRVPRGLAKQAIEREMAT